MLGLGIVIFYSFNSNMAAHTVAECWILPRMGSDKNIEQGHLKQLSFIKKSPTSKAGQIGTLARI